jgi:hypothetical protein
MRVYLVWARVGGTLLMGGSNTVLKAFRSLKAAEAHVKRATAYREDEQGFPLLSYAELVGISAMWVEELPVEER